MELLNVSVGSAGSNSSGVWGPECGEASRVIWAVGAPVILLVGLCGNGLILAVMGQRAMRGTAPSTYLRTMAVADILALITGIIPEWLEITFNWVFKELHPATCKLEKFLFYSSADTSIWILVIFTVERLLAVCFPLRTKDQCVPSRSKIFVLEASLLALVKNAHVFWTRGAIYETPGDPTSPLVSNCGRGPTPEFTHFENYVRPWLVLALVDAVPFVIILVSNVFIIRGLVRIQEEEHLRRSSAGRQVVQVSSTCISASVCFLVCITPSMVLLIGRPWWSSSPACTYMDTKALSNLIVYIHHSVNFFLYCLTGSRFRAVLRHIVADAKESMARWLGCVS